MQITKSLLATHSAGEKWRRGSFTVEAVLIIPMALWLIFLLISLDFLIHEKNWYTCSAYESAMLADSEGRMDEEKGQAEAKQRMQEKKQQYPLPQREKVMSVQCEEKKSCVKVTGTVMPVMGQGKWDYEISAEIQRLHPVKTIRKIRAVKSIFQTEQ